jgi:hypothetical protein
MTDTDTHTDKRPRNEGYEDWPSGRNLPANYPGPNNGSGNGSGNGNGNGGEAPPCQGSAATRRRNRNRNRGNQGSTPSSPLPFPLPTFPLANQALTAPAVPTMATVTTAAHFWATATLAQIGGFPSTTEALANNIANETRNCSLYEPLGNTPYFLETHRPLEADENLFDPEISEPRTRAVVGGWVQRAEDVGRVRTRWEERVVDEAKAAERLEREDWERRQMGAKTNKEKKQEWWDKNKPPPGGCGGAGGRGQQPCGHPPLGQQPSGQQPFPGQQALLGQLSFNQPSFGQPSLIQQPPLRRQSFAQARPDWGNFEDTDDFYLDSAEMASNLKEFNPEATVFDPSCKSGGNFIPSRRQDDPDDDLGGGMGGGLGAPEQVV